MTNLLGLKGVYLKDGENQKRKQVGAQSYRLWADFMPNNQKDSKRL